VVPRLGGGEPAVPVGVPLDLVDVLPGVLGLQLVQPTLHPPEHLDLDADVRGRAARPAEGWCTITRVCGKA